MDAKPTARTDNLIIEELGDGIVVYDSLTQEAHALDPQAASVWRAANGRRSIADIATAVALEAPVVVAALDQLQARGLLVATTGVSRRAMLRRSATLGAAAVAAAPLVETVLIPTAAAHASTAPPTPEPIRIAEIDHDEMSAVVKIPFGFALPGRFLIRRGDTKVFAPIPQAVFGVKVGPVAFKFINDVTTPGVAPYHYILRGKDGLGQVVNVIIPGTPGATVEIPLGLKLDIAVYWVQDVAP